MGALLGGSWISNRGFSSASFANDHASWHPQRTKSGSSVILPTRLRIYNSDTMGVRPDW